MYKKFELNTVGRDFVVGDIHGCFTRLQYQLTRIGFNPETDRLFSVGDLVDRGEESESSIDWLAKPWFHAVRGNHEQMAIDYAEGFEDPYYSYNGGDWFLEMSKSHRELYHEAFKKLPLAIEIVTGMGNIGIVHAEPFGDDWDKLKILIDFQPEMTAQHLMWSRTKIQYEDESVVKNIRAVVCGHTPLTKPTILGNVHFIDTGAVFGKPFTILDLDTLEIV
jgi:serine/threonine protein phosphatase 1